MIHIVVDTASEPAPPLPQASIIPTLAFLPVNALPLSSSSGSTPLHDILAGIYPYPPFFRSAVPIY